MLFTTLDFILFLAIALGIFAWLGRDRRTIWLLMVSLVFYCSFGISNLSFLILIIIAAWIAGVAIRRTQVPRYRRAALAVSLVLILGSLVVLKFYDFLVGETEALLANSIVLPRLGITAPVGYSFYVFMAAAYVIDVYRSKYADETSLGRVAFYLAWFPKILAGPVERAPNFLSQIPHGLRLDPILVVSGLQLIMWGLFKKVVVADNLAPTVDAAFAVAPYASPMELLIAVYFFAFQIYCDFSGYSDIAIGLSLLFGIRLMENFRRPYLACSTAEFWSSRWHISLGQWFRDYLYIPLGGGREGRLRHYANVMLVFVVSGLWHAGLGYGVGWSFLVWGALNGLYQWVGIATHGLWRKLGYRLPTVADSVLGRSVRITVTFHLILVSWIFFRADSVEQAMVVMRRIWTALPTLPALLPNYPFTAAHMLGVGLIAILMSIEILDERRPIFDRLTCAPRFVRWGVLYAGFFVLILLGRWQAEQFIYMQF